MVAYNGKLFIFKLSLIDLLLIFFPFGYVILIQWFFWVLRQTIKLSTSPEIFSSGFLVSF